VIQTRKQAWRAKGMTQGVEYLSSKFKALSSNTSTTKKKKKRLGEVRLMSATPDAHPGPF
jgi:hypothetical protein